MLCPWRLPGVAALILLSGLLLSDRAPADETAVEPAPAAIDELIHRLASDDFEARQEASRRLTAAGLPALPALQAAASDSPDAEVRIRAEYAAVAIRNRYQLSKAFSRRVVELGEVVAEDSALEPSQADVVEHAVKALFAPDQNNMPREVATALRRVHAMDPAERANLLCAAAAAKEGYRTLDLDADLDRVIERALKQIDPYAALLNNSASLRLECSGNFQGVGLELRRNAATRRIQVVRPLKGGPAYKAGVRSDDVLVGLTRYANVDGDPLDKPDVVNVAGMDVAEVNAKLSGLADHPVRLAVEREGVDHPLEFLIDHASVDPETVLGFRRTKDDDWNYWLDPKQRIAYIRLTRFDEDTAAELARALEKLNGQDMRGMILDLRFNPGGLLSTAVDVSELFVEEGRVLTIRPRSRPDETISVRPRGWLRTYALVCLVNSETASSGEIVAACLQDHGRARIAGERSHGKGSVQNIRKFGDDRLKLTTAMILRPNGKKLDRMAVPGLPDDEWGVSPDVGLGVDIADEEREGLRATLERRTAILPSERAPADPAFEDRQLERALQVIRKDIGD